MKTLVARKSSCGRVESQEGIGEGMELDAHASLHAQLVFPTTRRSSSSTPSTVKATRGDKLQALGRRHGLVRSSSRRCSSTFPSASRKRLPGPLSQFLRPARQDGPGRASDRGQDSAVSCLSTSRLDLFREFLRGSLDGDAHRHACADDLEDAALRDSPASRPLHVRDLDRLGEGEVADAVCPGPRSLSTLSSL